MSACSRIDERLLCGARPGRAVAWSELQGLGVSVLFSLVADPPEDAPGWLLREAHPLQDRALPAQSGADLRYLARTTQRLEALRAAGRIVYVHCISGVSRTGLVLCAWRMQTARARRDPALAWLRERRPSLDPNAGFMALLADWECSLGL